LVSACTPLLYDPDESVQCAAVEGFCKLLLHDRLDPQNDHEHDQVLLGLLTLFFHPTTKGHVRLRQCLSYFLHAYSFSTAARQARVRMLVVPCMEMMINMPIFGGNLFNQLLYFSDPHRNNQLTDSGVVDWSGLVRDLLMAAVKHHGDPVNKMSKFVGAAAKVPLSPRQQHSVDQQTVKECSFLCNAVLLRRCATSHSISTALKKVSSALAVLDDPTVVLERERMERVLAEVREVSGELLAAGGEQAERGASVKRQYSRKGVSGVENVMDNLQDIID
jgi:hypothetical protein